jgi:hypothetical protein
MDTFRKPQSAFRPETLSAFDMVFDEVWHELLADGTFQPLDTSRTRTRLAQKVLAFASYGWTEIQIKQLLLRAFRNEAARQHRIRRLQLVVDARPQRTAAASAISQNASV